MRGEDFTSYTLQINEQLCRGRYYDIEVVAYRENDKSTASRIGTFIGGDLVPKMVGCRLNKEDPLTSVDIRWEPPEKTPLCYKVCVVGEPPREVRGTTTYAFSDLKKGSKYKFSVAAVYENGESDGSLTNEITTDPRLSNQVPHLFLRPLEDKPHSGIFVQWGGVVDGEMYKVVAKHEDYLQEILTEDTTCTILGLSPDTEYEISVYAGNNEGYGVPKTSTCKTELEAPSDIKLCSKSSNAVTVNFDAVTGISEYTVSLHDAEGKLLERNDVKTNSHTFKKLPSNKKYYAMVRSKKDNFKSGKRKSSEVLTGPAVKQIKLSHSENNLSSDIKLEWEKGGGDIHEIEIKTDKEVEQILKIENKNSCFYRCLKPGGIYTARLRVKNDAGFSKWSKPKVLQLVKPLPPKDVKIKLDKVTPWCVADITWDRPETVKSFKVQIYDGDEMFDEFTHDNSYKFVHGKPSRCYEVKIFSQDSSGVLSEEAITKSFEMAPLPSPKHINIELDDLRPWRKAYVMWDQPDGIEYFKIELHPSHLSQNGTEILTQKANSYEFERGTRNSEYEIRIYSGHLNHISQEPSVEKFRMGDLPEVPFESIVVELNEEESKVITKWEKPPGVDSFKIIADIYQGTSVLSAGGQTDFIVQGNIHEHTYDGVFNHFHVSLMSGYSESEYGKKTEVKQNFFYPNIMHHSFHLFRMQQYIHVDAFSNDPPPYFEKLTVYAEGESGNIIMEGEKDPNEQGFSMPLKLLVPGCEYRIYATVTRGKYVSLKSHVGTCKAAPEEVKGLEVEQFKDSITVTWDHNHIRPGKYEIVCISDYGVEVSKSVEENTVKLSGIELGQSHELKIRACNYQNIYNYAQLEGPWTSITFRTAPKKPTRPRIISRISSKSVTCECSEEDAADRYRFTLRKLSPANNEDSIHLVESNCCQLDGLERGQKYSVFVEAGNEPGFSEASDPEIFTTSFNTEEIISEVKERSLKYFREKLPKKFLTAELKVLSEESAELNESKLLSVDEFLHFSRGDLFVVEGDVSSGKTTLCYHIGAKFASNKIVFVFDGNRGLGEEFFAMKDYIHAYLSASLDLNLLDGEMNRLFKWLKINEDKILFIIDDIPLDKLNPESSYLKIAETSVHDLLCKTLHREMFKKSCVLTTTSNWQACKKFKPNKVLCLSSYEKEDLYKYVKNDNELALKWKKMFDHSPNLCMSAKHCFFALNLAKSCAEKNCNFHCPAWVHIQIYLRLCAESKQEQKLIFDHISTCKNSFQIYLGNDMDLSGLSVHDKFVLAMHAVLIFQDVKIFLSLFKDCKDEKFLILLLGILKLKNFRDAMGLIESKQCPESIKLRKEKLDDMKNAKEIFLAKGDKFYSDHVKELIG